MNAYDTAFRRAVLLVALLNLAYFGVEFTVAVTIKSVSLFADSIDFLEDTSVNLLIYMAIGWSIRRRAIVGMFLSGILLVPGVATICSVWQKFISAVPPDPILLSFTGFGAMVVNLICAIILVRS